MNTPTIPARRRRKLHNLLPNGNVEPWILEVRRELFELGMTQYALGQLAEINACKINHILTGKVVASEIHKKQILQALGMTTVKPSELPVAKPVENVQDASMLQEGTMIRFEENGDISIFSKIDEVKIGTPQHIALIKELIKRSGIPTI